MENHCYLLVFFFMLSIMFSEVIALKFDLSTLSNAMWDIIRYYQVNSVFLKKEIEVHIIEENIHRDFKFRILFLSQVLARYHGQRVLNMTMEELCVSVSPRLRAGCSNVTAWSFRIKVLCFCAHYFILRKKISTWSSRCYLRIFSL